LDYCSGEVKLVPRNWSRVEMLELADEQRNWSWLNW
jgi:hypothetical protein